MEWLTLIRRQGRKAGVGVLLLGLLGGCYAGKTCCHDPACPSPNGFFTRQLLDNQAAKAEMDDFVIYKNYWYMDGTKLGPFGQYMLLEMLKRLPTVPFPVVIQPSTDPALNDARWQCIVSILAEKGIEDADHRVIVAFPQAEGLYSECEGERAFTQMLLPGCCGNYYGSYGRGFYGSGFGGFGGFGGGGFGRFGF